MGKKSSDYVIGLAEFFDLMGVLAVSASEKVKEFECLSREIAMDKFFSRLFSQQSIPCKPYFSERTELQ